MSVSAPATRPPVQDSAVAMVNLRIRQRSSSERERARASLPLMSVAPGQAYGRARHGGDAFLAAGKSEPFAGGRLDGDTRDADPGDFGDARAHGVAQRPDLGALADRAFLEIANPPSARGHPL